MQEDHRRSVCKAISWRVFGTIFTMIVAFIFTRKITLSLGIGMVDSLFKIFSFYFHERIWEKIPWGKAKHPLSELKIKKDLTSEDIHIISQNLKELGYL